MSDSARPHIGVVLMAYGTPRDRSDILPYYTDIRRGRPPTDEALAELTERYEAIGGVSPLAERTESQRAAVQATLDELAPDTYRVELGLKHADPKIEDTVDEFVGSNVEYLVGAVLAPHYSAYSVGQYLGRLDAQAAQHNTESAGVTSWATDPAFIGFIADDLRHRLDTMVGHTRVLFTAHSLPERILANGDPYPAELRATAEAVAAQVGLAEGADWQIAWQSAGRTPEPWIGPDILEVIDTIAADGDADGVIVSAVGFVADHLEVLYDLDIEARDRAESHGLRFDRTRCVNDHPEVMAALAGRIHAATAHWRPSEP